MKSETITWAQFGRLALGPGQAVPYRTPGLGLRQFRAWLYDAENFVVDSDQPDHQHISAADVEVNPDLRDLYRSLRLGYDGGQIILMVPSGLFPIVGGFDHLLDWDNGVNARRTELPLTVASWCDLAKGLSFPQQQETWQDRFQIWIEHRKGREFWDPIRSKTVRLQHTITPVSLTPGRCWPEIADCAALDRLLRACYKVLDVTAEVYLVNAQPGPLSKVQHLSKDPATFATEAKVFPDAVIENLAPDQLWALRDRHFGPIRDAALMEVL